MKRGDEETREQFLRRKKRQKHIGYVPFVSSGRGGGTRIRAPAPRDTAGPDEHNFQLGLPNGRLSSPSVSLSEDRRGRRREGGSFRGRAGHRHGRGWRGHSENVRVHASIRSDGGNPRRELQARAVRGGRAGNAIVQCPSRSSSELELAKLRAELARANAALDREKAENEIKQRKIEELKKANEEFSKVEVQQKEVNERLKERAEKAEKELCEERANADERVRAERLNAREKNENMRRKRRMARSRSDNDGVDANREDSGDHHNHIDDDDDADDIDCKEDYGNEDREHCDRFCANQDDGGRGNLVNLSSSENVNGIRSHGFSSGDQIGNFRAITNTCLHHLRGSSSNAFKGSNINLDDLTYPILSEKIDEKRRIHLWYGKLPKITFKIGSSRKKEKGRDFGGLTSHFFTELWANLAEKKIGGKKLFTSIDSNLGMMLPTRCSANQLSSETRRAYLNVGRFFCICILHDKKIPMKWMPGLLLDYLMYIEPKFVMHADNYRSKNCRDLLKDVEDFNLNKNVICRKILTNIKTE